MAQVLDEADRTDVEITRDERVVQPVRGVLGQHDVEQRAAVHETPVERQAVQELDVADPGALRHLTRLPVRAHFPWTLPLRRRRLRLRG